MPDDLKGLHKYIWEKVSSENLSRGVGMYSIGWIMYDIFERADHEQAKKGAPVTAADLDRFVQELPDEKINRDIGDAQQAFGRDAKDFMEEDTKERIQAGINDSIVATVKNFTSGWKAFGMNVIAGVVSGVIFAAASLALYFFVLVDPSVNAMGKAAIDRAVAPAAAGVAPLRQ